MMDGVLVMVIPFERLYDCAGLLSSHFARLNIFRLADEESVRFRQIAVFGIRRNVRGVAGEENKRCLQSVNAYGTFSALPDGGPGAWAPYLVRPSSAGSVGHRRLPRDQLA